MALKAPKGQPKQDFPQQANLEPGTYPGRVFQIIDYGLQPQKPYLGKDKKPVSEIGLTYELVDEFMKDEDGNDIKDKPRWISETLPFYGLYADKAKSTQRYNVFDPTGEWDGDFAKAIDIPLNVTVVNNQSGDKVYDNVGNISAMRPRDAANCPPLVNKPRVFDLAAPDLDTFNSFPKWIQDKIKGNLEYEGSPLQKLLAGAPGKVDKAEDKPKTKNRQEPVKEADDEAVDNNPY